MEDLHPCYTLLPHKVFKTNALNRKLDIPNAFIGESFTFLIRLLPQELSEIIENC